jgi:hypothetical protein
MALDFPTIPALNDTYTFEGRTWQWNGTGWQGFAGTHLPQGTIGITVDGGGSAITTGVKGYFRVPFDCEISEAVILADTTGDIKIDIWKTDTAGYPPVDADTITAGNEPEISTDVIFVDGTLTGWDVQLLAGDVLGYNVDSVSGITRATLILAVQRAS